MRAASALVVVCTLLTGFAHQPKEATKRNERSAEDVLEAFLVAMASQDETGIRREILPTENSEVLWQRERNSDEAFREFDTQLEHITFRDYKVGDTIHFWDGRKLKVSGALVNDDNKVLRPIIAGVLAPLPYPLVKVKNQWKVVADPTIAALLNAQRSKEGDKQADTRSPEEVLKAFFIALFENDEVGVRRAMLLVDNVEVLLKSQPIPDQARAQVNAELENLKFRSYKVGETIDLPGGKKMKVTADLVNENSKHLAPLFKGDTNPMPLNVLRVKGEWSVDPRPIIAARLAARRAMEKEAASQSKDRDERPQTRKELGNEEHGPEYRWSDRRTCLRRDRGCNSLLNA